MKPIRSGDRRRRHLLALGLSILVGLLPSTPSQPAAGNVIDDLLECTGLAVIPHVVDSRILDVWSPVGWANNEQMGDHGFFARLGTLDWGESWLYFMKGTTRLGHCIMTSSGSVSLGDLWRAIDPLPNPDP